MRIVLLTFLLTTISSTSHACSCRFARDIEQNVKKMFEFYDSVVVAQIESVEKTKITKYRRDQSYQTEGEVSTLIVSESWKGNHSTEIRTRIETVCCMCGMKLKEGVTYLLFLEGPDEDGFYSTSICAGNSIISEAAEKIEILDRLNTNKTLSPDNVRIDT